QPRHQWKWRQRRHRVARARREIGQQRRDGALLPIAHETQHRASRATQPGLETRRVGGRIVELLPRDRVEQLAIDVDLDEADEQRQQLPAVVWLLPLYVPLAAEAVDARRSVGDDVSQVGVAAEAANE